MLRAGFLVLALGSILAACGTAPQDRAISGGGIGAAAGAVVGAVTGLSVFQGALIGTGLGAAFGAFTDPEKVNLGEPIWQHYATTPSTAQGGAASGGRAKTSNMVAATQANLARLGYEPGPIDGQYGRRTGRAIRKYQQDHGLPVDGKLTGQVALEIEDQSAGLPQ